MTIHGGNVHADSQLTADIGGDLTVESLQNRSRTSNNTLGISAGTSFGEGGSVTGASGGLNASNGMSVTRETVRSSLTSGGTADITVAGNTQITAATIGTIDEEGNDLGNLNLTTGSLNFTNLRDIHQSSQTSGSLSTSVSLGGGGGNEQAKDGKGREMTVNTTNLTYSNTSEYSAGNSLATLGTGNITVGGTLLEENGELTEAGQNGDSPLAGLNRDTTDTTYELWDVERTEGNVDLQVDHRMFSEEGRKKIKEDFKRSELLGSSMLDVAMEESVTLQDSLQHIGDVQKDFDVQKLMATRNNGMAAEILNNLDVATSEQKEMALDMYAQAYAEVYGINIKDAKIIAANEIIGGAHYYSDNENSVIYVNDNAQENGLDYANTMGHEVTHAQVSQGTIRDRENHDLNEQYANIRGDYAEENYGFSFANNGLGVLNTGSVNNHIGNSTSESIRENNSNFGRTAVTDPDNMDYYLTGKVVSDVVDCVRGVGCSSPEEVEAKLENAKKFSSFLDDEMNNLCAKNPTSDACRTSVNTAIDYVAMPEAWDVLSEDVERSSKNTFDHLYNAEGAEDRFTVYLNTIDNRTDFFGASDEYEQNVGIGAKWFGGQSLFLEQV